MSFLLKLLIIYPAAGFFLSIVAYFLFRRELLKQIPIKIHFLEEIFCFLSMTIIFVLVWPVVVGYPLLKYILVKISDFWFVYESVLSKIKLRQKDNMKY